MLVRRSPVAVRPGLLAGTGRGINPLLVEVFRGQIAQARRKSPKRIQHDFLGLGERHALGVSKQRRGQIIITQDVQPQNLALCAVIAGGQTVMIGGCSRDKLHRLARQLVPPEARGLRRLVVTDLIRHSLVLKQRIQDKRQRFEINFRPNRKGFRRRLPHGPVRRGVQGPQSRQVQFRRRAVRQGRLEDRRRPDFPRQPHKRRRAGVVEPRQQRFLDFSKLMRTA